MTVELRTELPRSRASLPDRGFGRSTERRAGDGPTPRARGSGRDRPAIAVRGGDPGRGDRARPLARAGHRGLRRGARLLPGDRSDHRRGRSVSRGRSSGSRPASGVPIIASLNAHSAGGWVRYARLIQDAGADALELNLYRVAADPRQDGGRDGSGRPGTDRGRPRGGHDPARDQAQPVLLGLRQLRRGATAAGADGLVLFNRFYQPDLDLEALEVVPRIELSHSWEHAAAGALDRHPATPARAGRVARGDAPASTLGPTWSRASWSAPTS